MDTAKLVLLDPHGGTSPSINTIIVFDSRFESLDRPAGTTYFLSRHRDCVVMMKTPRMSF
jgi:hypothetical protein